MRKYYYKNLRETPFHFWRERIRFIGNSYATRPIAELFRNAYYVRTSLSSWHGAGGPHTQRIVGKNYKLEEYRFCFIIFSKRRFLAGEEDKKIMVTTITTYT